MPSQNDKQTPERSQGTGAIIAIIVILLVLGLGAGLYYWRMMRSTRPAVTGTYDQPLVGNGNEPPDTSLPSNSSPATSSESGSNPLPNSGMPTTPDNAYMGWKTYTYRTSNGSGFSFKYPPGTIVSQERTKEEIYFEIYSDQPGNPLMRIYYETDGAVRFSPTETNPDWTYYDEVVRSFSKWML